MRHCRHAITFKSCYELKVGMLAKCKDNPTVQKMISSANDILGYDLLEAALRSAKFC